MVSELRAAVLQQHSMCGSAPGSACSVTPIRGQRCDESEPAQPFPPHSTAQLCSAWPLGHGVGVAVRGGRHCCIQSSACERARSFCVAPLRCVKLGLGGCATLGLALVG